MYEQSAGQTYCLLRVEMQPKWCSYTYTNGENRLQNHLWCPNDPRGEGIDDDDDDLYCVKDSEQLVLRE